MPGKRSSVAIGKVIDDDPGHVWYVANQVRNLSAEVHGKKIWCGPAKTLHQRKHDGAVTEAIMAIRELLKQESEEKHAENLRALEPDYKRGEIYSGPLEKIWKMDDQINFTGKWNDGELARLNITQELIGAKLEAIQAARRSRF